MSEAEVWIKMGQRLLDALRPDQALVPTDKQLIDALRDSPQSALEYITSERTRLLYEEMAAQSPKQFASIAQYALMLLERHRD